MVIVRELGSHSKQNDAIFLASKKPNLALLENGEREVLEKGWHQRYSMVMDSFFLQMSGVPGAGKTTIATAVSAQTRAVIIDHDITKSALLEANVPVDLAGVGSYQVLGALARHLLAQGHSVIHDSPCRYQNLLDRGQQLAAEFGAAYKYIECVVDDLDEIDRRLRTRRRHPSQLAGVYSPPTAGSGKTVFGEAMFREWMAGMKRPKNGYLLLDMSRPLATCIAEALAYVEA